MSYPPRPEGPGVPATAGSPGGGHGFELVMSVVVVAVAVAVFGWLVLGRAGGSDPNVASTPGATSSAATTSPTTSGTATSGDETTSTPQTSPSTKTRQTASKATDSEVRAVGTAWPAAADTYHFDNAGIPEFDGPTAWGCLSMGKGSIGLSTSTASMTAGPSRRTPTAQAARS